MSMAQQELDYTTLKWVKNEIQESLNQTRQALESFVEDPNDTTQIRFCVTYLHQIYGTLQMVEIYGGALLAEEMELLANAVLQGKVARKDDAYDVLMRAILQLPAYLEHLENGQQDLPVILLPLLNDLRTARGEHLLSENAFFSPNLSVIPPDEAKTSDNKQVIDVSKYARKLRPVYQAALVGIYRNQNIPEALRKIAIVIRELLYNSQAENSTRLWWVASGVVEGLLEGGLEISSSIKQLLGQLDRQLKRIINDGEAVFVDAPPIELLKNLLYYVATSKSKGRRVGQIKLAFNLEQLLPGGGDINEAFEKLRGSNNDLMQSVATVIKEDLLHVKDQLDIFVRTKDTPVNELHPLSEHLGRISDTLAMLGLGDLHKIIQDQNKNIKKISQSDELPGDVSLMEIASALLYVESSLEGVKSPVYARKVGDGRGQESLLPPSEQKQLNNLVIREATLVVAQVKENFNAYAVDTSNREIIKSTPELLDQVRGVLAILSLDNAANLLSAAMSYVKSDLLAAQVEPNQTALDLLADVITSIEYYLEAIVESRGHPDSILTIAEESISKLGYPVDAVTPRSASTELPKHISLESVAAASLAAQRTVEEPIEERSIEKTSLPPIPLSPVQETSPTVSPVSTLPESDDIDEEILEIFVEEADEVVGAIRENLQTWRQDNHNEDALAILRRSYHTIKGSGRLAGAKVVGEFAWAIEDMLNRIIDKKIELRPEVFELLEKAESLLEESIQHLKGERATQPNVQPLIDLANGISNGTFDVAQTVALNTDSAEEEDAVSISQITQDAALVDIFKKETDTHLNAIGEYVSNYAQVGEGVVSEPLMRALHTLHGSANMARVSEIADLSEHLDRYFRTLHDTKQIVNSGACGVLTEGADIIRQMVDAVRERNVTPPDTTKLIERISALHDVAKQVETPNSIDVFSIVPSEENIASPNISVPDFSLHESVSHEAVDEGSDVSSEEDRELVEIFLEEAEEILGNTEALIQGWSNALNDMSIMEELQRALHTLKGGARMASQAAVADVSHQIESLLEGVTEGLIQTSVELPKVVHRCQDWLIQSLDAIRHGDHVNEPTELLALIDSLIKPSDQNVTAELAAVSEMVVDELQDLDELVFSDDDEQVTVLELEEPTSIIEPPDEDQDLLNIFVDEATEIQESNDASLQEWRRDYQNLDCVASLQRALHTLKGGARMANITPIADIAHTMEMLLEEVVEKRIPVSIELPNLVQNCHDWLTQAITSVRDHVDLQKPVEQLFAVRDYQARMAVASAPTESSVSLSAAEFDFDDAPTVQIEDLTMLARSESVAADDAAELAEPTTAQDAVEEYDEDVIEIFLEEAEEIQENADRLLHEWVKDVDNRDLIAEMQRALHTLKGGARMANITPIGDLSHGIESLLEGITEGRLLPTPEYPQVVQACHDWLAHAIEKVKQQKPLTEATELTRQLDNLLSGKRALHGVEQVSDATPQEVLPEAAPVNLVELPSFSKIDDADAQIESQLHVVAKSSAARVADEQIRVKADLIDNMVNHAGEVNIYNARMGQQLGAWHFNLTELDQTVHRLHEQLRKFEIETEAQIMYRHSSDVVVNDDGRFHEQFDPLELDRFSTMQQLSRSMAESLNDLTNIQHYLDNISSETDVLLLQQSRVNTDLQEGLMSTRMTPFSSVIARLRRVVRQTCQETGKEAELKVNGAEGEMDRTQLNRVIPALEHILRNAVDHGIEQPAQRIKASKPESGSIEINFSREGSEVVLHISDDGAGIDIDAIRKKAIERGLISASSNLGEDEVIDFILQSGFSTATSVTQISGRGVGMDVVNTEIKQLNGSLHIETKHGRGSSFIIRLPLTVLVNQALMIQVDEAVYAIQLSNVEHVIRQSGEQLNQFITGKEKALLYAGQHYQHLNIGYVLHGTAPRMADKKTKHPLLLARSGEHRVALQVDALIGRQEIVIKSVGAQLSSVNSISGATIMPDGTVALILDLATLIRTSHAVDKIDANAQVAKKLVEPNKREKRPTVLIVDDSITVRKVSQRLLKRHNYDTWTAKDGVDALTVMLEHIPDIMLLDIEMPRMDGYELATAMRNDERLKHIPIIMITSRTGEKHRDRAFRIGVNNYMGKPFQEQELLENLQALLQDKK
ncbi:MAG: response regulator [Gammaproteobacteria bacterium]|nr:response regulator [Gammaproteobacteria bacterium]